MIFQKKKNKSFKEKLKKQLIKREIKGFYLKIILILEKEVERQHLL